jgi:hypothetical protein
MLAPGAFLGIDSDSWGVILAALALAVSLYSAWGARGSEQLAQRSAMAAEKSATSTVASAEASGRSANAAEHSAEHAARSAMAAERLAAAQERAVAIDEDRAAQERRERADRHAPRWHAIDETEGSWWTSDDNNLTGVLINGGTAPTSVTRVRVDMPGGGGLDGRYEREPHSAIGGGFSKLTLPPGGGMRVTFATTDGSLGAGIAGDVRPRIVITSTSEDIDWTGDRTVELLRRSGGVSSAVRWQPRPVT